MNYRQNERLNQLTDETLIQLLKIRFILYNERRDEISYAKQDSIKMVANKIEL